MLSPISDYKLRVKKAFSKHALSYDLHAGLQAHAARHTAALLQSLNTRSAIADGEVLEIGCGTGLFTGEILKILSRRKIICTDISQSMLEACKLRIQLSKSANDLSGAEIVFKTLDAEEMQTGNKEYAVIASSFAFQWFYNPIEGMSRLLKALKPGGVMIFSVPGNKSCPLWQKAARKLDIPFTRNPLPDLDEIQKLAGRSGMEFRLQSHLVNEHYRNALSMMRSLKELGAGTQRHNLSLSCVQLRKLLRELDSEMLQDSYQVISGYFRRLHK